MRNRRVQVCLLLVLATVASGGLATAIPETPFDRLITTVVEPALPRNIAPPCVPSAQALMPERDPTKTILPPHPPPLPIPQPPQLPPLPLPPLPQPPPIVIGRTVSLPAPPYDRNLIANGGAELDDAATDSVSIVRPSFWISSGATAAVAYGTAGGFPSASSTGPANRGKNFFAGGPGSGQSVAYQDVDVSDAAATIDIGQTRYTLGGYLGGFEHDRDSVRVDAQFFDDVGRSKGTARLNAVEPRARLDSTLTPNATGMMGRSASDVVPRWTRRVRITMTFTRVDGDYNDAYADELSLVLRTSCTNGSLQGHNLIANGGAEQGAARTGSKDVVVPVEGWTVQSNLTTVRYATAGFPGSPAAGNLTAFAGQTARSVGATATQQFSVGDKLGSGAEAPIIRYHFSGSFGTLASGGCSFADATFHGPNGVLGSVQVGMPGVCASGGTALAAASTAGTLPANTERITVTLTLARCGEVGCFGGGLADDLVFALGAFDGRYKIRTVYNGGGYRDVRVTDAAVGAPTPVIVESASGARPAVIVHLAVLGFPLKPSQDGDLPEVPVTPNDKVMSLVPASWRVQMRVDRDRSWTPAISNGRLVTDRTLPISVEILYDIGSCGDEASFGYDTTNIPDRSRTAPDAFTAVVDVVPGATDDCSDATDNAVSLEIASTVSPVPALAVTGGIARSARNLKRASVEFTPVPSATPPAIPPGSPPDARIRFVHTPGREELTVDVSRQTALRGTLELFDRACTSDCTGIAVTSTVDRLAAGVASLKFTYDHPASGPKNVHVRQLATNPTITADVTSLEQGSPRTRTYTRLEGAPTTVDLTLTDPLKVVLAPSGSIGALVFGHASCLTDASACRAGGGFDTVNDVADHVRAAIAPAASWMAVRLSGVVSGTLEVTPEKVYLDMGKAAEDVHVVVDVLRGDTSDLRLRGWLRNVPLSFWAQYEFKLQKFTAASRTTSPLPTAELWIHTPNDALVKQLQPDGTCLGVFNAMYLKFRIPQAGELAAGGCGSHKQSGGLTVSGLGGSDAVVAYDNTAGWATETAPSPPAGHGGCEPGCWNLVYMRPDRMYARLFALEALTLTTSQECDSMDFNVPCATNATIDVTGGGRRDLVYDDAEPVAGGNKTFVGEVGFVSGSNKITIDSTSKQYIGLFGPYRRTETLEIRYDHTSIVGAPPKSISVNAKDPTMEFLTATLSPGPLAATLPPTFTICMKSNASCTDATGLNCNPIELACSSSSLRIAAPSPMRVEVHLCESCHAKDNPVGSYLNLTLKEFGLAQLDRASGDDNAMFLDTDGEAITGTVSSTGYGSDGSYAKVDLFFGGSSGGSNASDRKLVWDIAGVLPVNVRRTGPIVCGSGSTFQKNGNDLKTFVGFCDPPNA